MWTIECKRPRRVWIPAIHTSYNFAKYGPLETDNSAIAAWARSMPDEFTVSGDSVASEVKEEKPSVKKPKKSKKKPS